MATEDKKPIRLIEKQDGTLHAFEVNCSYATLKSLCSCVSKIPDVVITKQPRSRWIYFAWGGQGARGTVEFSYKGHEFVIDGQNPWYDDYWIGAKDTKFTYPEISEILKQVEAEILRH
jgi:hypothetical protein